jgi:hypothetical protein
MRGAIPPFPNTPPLRGAHLRNSTGTTLPLTFKENSLLMPTVLISVVELRHRQTYKQTHLANTATKMKLLIWKPIN